MIVTLSMIAAGSTAAAGASSNNNNNNNNAAAAAAAMMKTHPAFMAGPSTTCHRRFGGFRHGRRRAPCRGSGSGGGGGVVTAQAVQSGQGSDGAAAGVTAVHDDSWYLGDGGFAKRHLEDEALLAAKKVR